MHRLFIVLPVYAAVVIFLPRQDWFRPFADQVASIHPDVSFWVSMCLGAAAALAFWVIRNRPFKWMFARPRVTEVIGMGLLGGGIWGVGYAIVDMRIRQVLKRFLGTPMKKPHFVAAMMASRMVFMIPEIIVILILSRLIFNVVSHGGYVLIAVIVLLGAFQFASIGLIIASRARTLEAVAGLMNLTMVPMWIGSGIFFSAERFPALVQPVIRLLPLTPVISALRQVMQEGAGLVTILPDLGLMAAWLVVTFAVALRIFRWD